MNKLTLATLLLFSAQPVLAGQTLDFEQLKDACRNPAKYHSQVQPTGIKVDCADRQLKWVPSTSDQGSLSCHRLVGFSISSDKYTVPMNKAPLDLPSVGTECPVFKQIEETVNTSQNLTCEQLLNFKGTAVDLCQQMIDQARLDNPQAVNLRETGKEHHLCQTASADKGIQQQGDKGIQQDNKGVQQGNKGVQQGKGVQDNKGVQQGKQERGQRQVQGKQERGQRGAAQQQGNRPASGNQTGNQPSGDQPTGDQPTGDQPTGDQPTGEHR